jgi:hypothetical protein
MPFQARRNHGRVILLPPHLAQDSSRPGEPNADRNRPFLVFSRRSPLTRGALRLRDHPHLDANVRRPRPPQATSEKTETTKPGAPAADHRRRDPGS